MRISTSLDTGKTKGDMNSHNAEERMQDQNREPQLQQQKLGTTFLRTCFNGINTLSGVGILSIPYALSQGGWLSLIILFLVALICYYTGLLLQRCMDADPLITTYPEIGEVAFGRKGRVTISVYLYLELYLVAVGFLILEGDNLHKLYPNVCLDIGGGFKVGGKKVFVVLTALMVLPTTWLKKLGLLAYVSVGGIAASLVLVGSAIWVGAVDGVGFHERGILWRWSGLPNTISLYTFCYCGHAVFPTLRNSMKDRGKFSKVLLVCFILSTITYGSMAVLGYLMFGETLTSQITLNLPTKKMSSKIAIYTTLINPITKYAIIMYPIATAIEHSSYPFKNSRIMSLLIIRTGLVLSTVVVALVVPFFGYVMAFTGAFLSMSVSVLFPCICYLKICRGWEYRSLRIEYFVIITIMVFGAFVLITGTYTSLRDIINMFKKQK